MKIHIYTVYEEALYGIQRKNVECGIFLQGNLTMKF